MTISLAIRTHQARYQLVERECPVGEAAQDVLDRDGSGQRSALGTRPRASSVSPIR